MTFGGFSPYRIAFLNDRGGHTTREWFQAHRQAYETYLLAPAGEFVLAMGECLPKLGAGIHAEPRIRGSIFASHRDARLSTTNEMTPYKPILTSSSGTATTRAANGPGSSSD